MPKAYSEKERLHIITDLHAAAFSSMLQKGIKKTTVDELVEKVHIPKGTFYLFYPSKELLLYDALMQEEEKVHQQLFEKIATLDDSHLVESLTDLLFEFFQLGFSIGILPLMISGELDILMRKLPDEIINEHISKDDEFLSVFRMIFPGMNSEKLNEYSAAFRAIFFTAAYQREIGKEYDSALKLLIRGLVMQMNSENQNQSYR